MKDRYTLYDSDSIKWRLIKDHNLIKQQIKVRKAHNIFVGELKKLEKQIGKRLKAVITEENADNGS